ncbi:MAG: 4Fe-4S ferredoxin, partial [Desulfovibrio sp.]
MSNDSAASEIPRQNMDVDIVCVGFGPAMGGFLTTLTRGLNNEDGTPAVQSKTMPGMPPQIICYERADDIGFGVSGVVTKGRSIKASFPDFDPAQVPMATDAGKELVYYLLDPVKASRRSWLLRWKDFWIKTMGWMLPYKDHALRLPFIPGFLKKHGGYVLSIGQFNQWVGSQLMGSGLAQIWPGTPVSEPLMHGDAVTGVRLADQGVDKQGEP